MDSDGWRKTVIQSNTNTGPEVVFHHFLSFRHRIVKKNK